MRTKILRLALFGLICPLDALEKINPRPLLFIHGELDRVIPAVNSQRLYETYRGPKDLYLVPNAGHGDFWESNPDAFPRRLFQFVKGCLLKEQ